MSNTKVMLGTGKIPARSTFMFLRELKEDDNGNLKCGTGILISKKDKKSVEAMKKAVSQAGKKKYGMDFDAADPGCPIDLPFQDGDELVLQRKHKERKEIKGHYVLNAKAYSLPDVVSRSNTIVIGKDREEVLRSGNYFIFCIDFKPYNPNGGGIRAEIKSMMFIKEGPALDGSLSGEEEFADYALDDEDEGITLEMLEEAFDAAKKVDRRAARKVLKATGESSLEDVDEDDYEDLLADLEAAGVHGDIPF